MNQIEHNGVTLKVGDTVTVHRKVADHAENGMGPLGGWDNVWTPPMDAAIGKQYRIKHIGPTGIRMHRMAPDYGFPLLSVLPDYPKLLLAGPASKTPYTLKPFQRVVTRNGWQWIVGTHEGIKGAPVAIGEPFFLIREGGTWTHVTWPGTTSDDRLDVTEVYDAPVHVFEILELRKRGELRWHEAYDAQQAERARTLAVLQQQRADLEARINELGGQ